MSWYENKGKPHLAYKILQYGYNPGMVICQLCAINLKE